ncbi:MAG: RNA polymerase sigma factor [PVC group bacterium]
MTDRKDREIIEEIRSGNVDAFEKLIVRYENRVFAIVSRHLPADKAAETAHDVFCRAYRSLGGYRPEKPFEHWISKVAVRTCCDYWRRNKRSREIAFSAFEKDGREVLDAILSEKANDQYNVERRRLHARELLDRLLGRLPAEDRMALSLTYLEGHSLREAAEMMDWSAARMKVRSHRARRALQKALPEVLDETGGHS